MVYGKCIIERYGKYYAGKGKWQNSRTGAYVFPTYHVAEQFVLKHALTYYHIIVVGETRSAGAK